MLAPMRPAMSLVLAGIDWQRPWLAHWREQGLQLQAAPDWLVAINAIVAARALTNTRGLALRFVAQNSLPPDTGYEAYIHEHGQVPTRDNLHDFFNGLAWLRFPQIKRTLNALQAAEIQRRLTMPSAGGSRGRQRDAATLFDENAAVFICSDPALIQALRAHDWQTLLQDRAGDFGRCYQVELFGHALLEKLVQPYKAITAHAWVMAVEASWFALGEAARRADIDTRLATQLQAGFTSADFTPLPVLGVPNWWPEQNTAFYHDAAVFRPKRIRSAL